MDQTRKFGEQTSRILEFKPEGLDFYNYYNVIFISTLLISALVKLYQKNCQIDWFKVSKISRENLTSENATSSQ